MTDQPCPAHLPTRAIQNLRITLWGVQGSCPIFPTPASVEDYSRSLAIHTLTRAVEDIRRKAADQPISIETLLNGPPTHANIQAYQRRLGLPNLPLYGGETTCIQVETSDNHTILFDAGSGLRRCSQHIASAWENRPDRTLHLFGTHEHLDHRSGLVFARFCYTRPNPYKINVYANHAFLDALDSRYGIFSHILGPSTHMDDPVDYKIMTAAFTATELRPHEDARPLPRHWATQPLDQPIQIGKTTLTPFHVYHGAAPCLAYKLQHNGKTFVFCTDHELRRGPANQHQEKSLAAEATLRKHCANADLLYVDGQYFLDEYLGNIGLGPYPPAPRLDWGHGCIEDAVERAFECNIARTLVGHHDPERTWSQRLEMDRLLSRTCEGKPNRIQLADGDATIDL